MTQPEENLDWALAVGRALIAFGQIEHATHMVIKGICKDPISSATASLGLDKKIEIADAVLSQYADPKYVELRDGLRRAKGLATTRNLIAHNPLAFDFYEYQDGSFLIEQRISSLRSEGKHVTLKQTQDFAQEAEALARQLIQSAVLC
jgi:hypothetical protein